MLLIKDELMLSDLYNQDYDNAQEGKCCMSINFMQYPEHRCFGRECLLKRKKHRLFPKTETQMDMDPTYAKSCVNIFIYQQLNWRICHRNKDMIIKLKNTIAYGVLKTKPGINEDDLLSKLNFNL